MMEYLATSPPVAGIKLAGGASRSPLWCQLLADISGYPIRIPEVADLACVAAAIQAGIGCGIYAKAEEGYRHMAIKEQVLYPQEKAVSRYAFLKNEYRRRAALLGGVYGILP
jgi:autoinducer 2 (AI-2) kinase